MSLLDSLGALREPQFRLFFLGRSIAQLGSAISPVAFAFAILELTGSASDLGIVFATQTVATVLFLLIGGVVADRLPRHHVMVVADTVQGAATAVFATLLLTGAAQMWQIVILAAVRGAAGAFFAPASGGIVPQIVSHARLQEANALLRLSRNGTSIGGAALGGILVATFGPGWAIAIDAATFGVSAVFLTRLSVPRTSRVQAPHFWSELREGWREFVAREWLWVIVVAFGFINAFWTAAYLVLGPVIAQSDLGGAAPWGFILAAGSAGFFLGAAFSLRFRPRHPMRAGMLACVLQAVPLFLLAAAAPTAVIALGAAFAGFGVEIFGVLWETAMQEHIPNEVLSRVSAYDWLGSIALMPIGYAIVGPLSQAIGTEETLLACATFVLVTTALTLLSADVRNLRSAAAAPEVTVEPA